MDNQNILICGGLGFIGSHFVKMCLGSEFFKKVSVLDAFTYAGSIENLGPWVNDSRIKVYPGKIQDSDVVSTILKKDEIGCIVNFAAETHNDRSIINPKLFTETNVLGIVNILEQVRNINTNIKVLHVSTDEVYGPATILPMETADGKRVDIKFSESSPLKPTSPYASSKAAGEIMARSMANTFGLKLGITRGGNTYGTNQYPEKLIPLTIVRALYKKKIPIYGNGLQSRQWMSARDHCKGILSALVSGMDNVYNIGDERNEIENIKIVRSILKLFGLGDEYINFIEDPRGNVHDLRYSMDNSKARSELVWKPTDEFDLAPIVAWYRENRAWVNRVVKSNEFQEFYFKFYKEEF